MPSLEARRLYQDAWNRLFSTVRTRNDLLRQLNSMVAPAMSITLATSRIVRMDTDLARQLLDEIDELVPRIDEGIAEVNKHAHNAGLPELHWQDARAVRW